MPLRAHGLTFSYDRARPVLSGLDAAFPAGAVTAIVGPNGSGKSTLLRLLAGLLSPDAGRVTMGEGDLQALPARGRARRIAYIAQRPAVSFAYPVRRVVAFGLHAAGLGDRAAEAQADAALARVGLAHRAGEAFGELSVGQQQLAALARALAQINPALDAPHRPPPFLLADEPTSAMDPRHALDAFAILRDTAARGAGVLLAAHDLPLARRFADRALVLDSAGRAVAEGAASEALAPAVLERVFGVRIAQVRVPGSDETTHVVLPSADARPAPPAKLP